MRKLYEPHAHPLTRVIQGLPTSWDPIIAARRYYTYIVAWSPCNRFIAVVISQVIKILDAMTLEQLNILDLPLSGSIVQLIFSPDCHLLTCLSYHPHGLATCDLQTGVLISTISLELQGYCGEFISHAYSTYGTMYGVLFSTKRTSTISIYNILSGVHIRSHSFELDLCNIWVYGNCFQSVTLQPESITIWEVGFTSEYPATEVKSLPVPNNFDPSKGYCFLPILCRLAFTLKDTVLVWDAQHSKLLLNSVDVKGFTGMTFSPDGHFFTCATHGPEIYLWKDSPTGYTLHQTITWISGYYTPLFSQNGKSIVMSGGSTLWLWHTTDPSTSSFKIPYQDARHLSDFILEFSPDKSLAIAARWANKTATVFDLKHGVVQLIIRADMEIYGLGISESTVVVVGNGKIITWGLPIEDFVLGVRVNIHDSIQTTIFNYPLYNHLPPHHAPINPISISPNLDYMAIMVDYEDCPIESMLYLFDIPTGNCLANVSVGTEDRPFLTLDKHTVWCYNKVGRLKGWSIIKDNESNIIKLENLGPNGNPLGIAPNKSSHGYKVMDGWILGSNKKRLLWLPPLWQNNVDGQSSHVAHIIRYWSSQVGLIWRGEPSLVWNGQFLALLYCELPEVIILELLEE